MDEDKKSIIELSKKLEPEIKYMIDKATDVAESFAKLAMSDKLDESKTEHNSFMFSNVVLGIHVALSMMPKEGRKAVLEAALDANEDFDLMKDFEEFIKDSEDNHVAG